METPTDRAALLGTEHGTQAAEEWLASPHVGADWARSRPHAWPQPDLDYLALGLLWDSGLIGSADQTPGVEIMGIYRGAFRSAVDATIRAKCEAVQ